MNKRQETISSMKTGEVLYESFRYIPELFNEDGYYFWNKRRQSRQFTGIELPLKSYDEKGIFGDLCRLYLADGSNLLEIRSRNKCRPFNVTDLQNMLNVSHKQATRRLNSLLRSGVIANLTITIGDRKEDWLVVNPLYFVSGKRISDTLYKLFRHDLDPYLSVSAKMEFANRVVEVDERVTDTGKTIKGEKNENL
jgi:DNA-binding Lrp family transcriptional regulator